MLGVADIGAGTGATSGTADSVVLESQASWAQWAEAVAVVQAWWVQAMVQKCEVWQEPAASVVTSEVVSVGLTPCS